MLTVDPQLLFLNLDYITDRLFPSLQSVFFVLSIPAKGLLDFIFSSFFVTKVNAVTGNEDVPHVPHGESQC